MGAIFLESFVVGAFRHVPCMRVCVLEVQAEVCRHVCTGHECMCAPVPLCLQGDKYSRRSWNQGEKSAEISTS